MRHLLLLLVLFFLATTAKQPNIVIVLTDDVGYKDLSYQGGQIPTPVLDSLAADGIKLPNHYSHVVCSPSRAALLTGRYAQSMGLTGVVLGHGLWELPPGTPTLPRELKPLNYSSHMVGKWHLGHCRHRNTPRGWGFDSFVGSLNGALGYYDKMVPNMGRADLQRDGEVFFTPEHMTTLLAKEAEKVVERHFSRGEEQPLFLMLALTAPHSPLEPEPEDVAKCQHIANPTRRDYCGLVTGVDRAVGLLVEALRRHHQWDDTLFLFSSDNGGMPHVGGFNSPLRGTKNSAWEGGSRALAFLRPPTGRWGLSAESSFVFPRGVQWEGLLHLSDWLPTLTTLAKSHRLSDEAAPKPVPFKLAPVSPADEVAQLRAGLEQQRRREKGQGASWEGWLGVSVLDALASLGPSPRQEVLGTMEIFLNQSSLRRGQWKVIRGAPGDSGLYEEPTGYWLLNTSSYSSLSSGSHWSGRVRFWVDCAVQVWSQFFERVYGKSVSLFWLEVFNHFRLSFHGENKVPSRADQLVKLYDLQSDLSESVDLTQDDLQSPATPTHQEIEKLLLQRLDDYQRNLPPQLAWRQVEQQKSSVVLAHDDKRVYDVPWLTDDDENPPTVDGIDILLRRSAFWVFAFVFAFFVTLVVLWKLASFVFFSSRSGPIKVKTN